MGNPQIVTTRPAHNSEAALLASLLASALRETPPARWLIPDPPVLRIRGPAYARVWVDHGLDVGTVEVAETIEGHLAGVAIWWTRPGPQPDNYLQRLTDAAGPVYVDRFMGFDALLRQRHPATEHVYLGFTAVAAPYRQRGHGTVLLRRRHHDLDASKVPAYAVAASAEARRLYLRHGYRDHGQPITLPGGPDMYPMWRRPATDPNSSVTTTRAATTAVDSTSSSRRQASRDPLYEHHPQVVDG